MIGLLAMTLAVAGCSSDDGDESQSAPVDEHEPELDDEVDEEREDEITDLFGLPVPPEYIAIRQTDQRARVTTRMGLGEIEDFFEREVVDYEVVREGRQVRLIPLRSKDPRVRAYYFSGPRSHVVVEYIRALDPDEHPVFERPSAADDDDEQEQEESPEVDTEPPAPRGPQVAPTAHTPDWLDDVRGEPVELRTADGDLLAPGARWGEPYTPPEGSPLHQERFRSNFGKPFGDWRSR